MKQHNSTFLICSTFFIVLHTLIALNCPVVHAAEKWLDRTGQFSIDAEFLALDGDVVVLQKPNGKEVRVSINKLGKNSQLKAITLSKGNQDAEKPQGAQGIESQLDDVKDLGSLEVLAKLQRTAKQAVALYEAFIGEHILEVGKREKAEKHLAKWQERADQELIRWGDRWETVEVIRQRLADEDRLLMEAHRLIDIGNDELARERFEEASKRNPEGIRGDFYLGILHALIGRNARNAEKHFSVCVQRMSNLPKKLSGVSRANLVASLNNRAICLVKMRRHSQAMKDWAQALQLAPMTPELVQNLGYYAKLASAAYGLRVPKSVRRRVSDQYARVTVANQSADYHEGIGWLFVPYVDALQAPSFEGLRIVDLKEVQPEEDERHSVGTPDMDFRIIAWATSVAVDDEHLLTARHPVEGSHGFWVTKKGQLQRDVPGKIAAISGGSDLVLLRFRNLGANSITLANNPPQRASDFWVVSFPEPGFAVQSAHILEGTVIDLSGLINHDVLLPIGGVGSPLIDKFGNVIGIDLGGGTPDYSLTRQNLALPANEIRSFLASTGLELHDVEQVRNIIVDDIYAHVNSMIDSSIYQIAIVGRVPRLSWTERIGEVRGIHTKEGWNAYEDPWCVICNGRGWVRCSDRRCANGIRRVQQDKYSGRDPITGREFYGKQWVSIKCDVCNGNGKIQCPHCGGNKIEPSI